MSNPTEENNPGGGLVPPPSIPPRGLWENCLWSMWRTPLGLIGVATTTVSIVLMMIGLALDLLGLVDNPYFAALCYMILPGFMILGLLIIPLACYIHSRHWLKDSLGAELTDRALCIDLSNARHRKYMIGFLALTVMNASILVIIGYEGYHFTDSPYFCGKLCHTVMAPEYTAYTRSAHAKIRCVECHIGPGVSWFVKAKISGLRQVAAVMTGDFSRPIPSPVEHLRPARDTCEQCHWPEKFHGKKIKTFTRFSNSNQEAPDVQEIALHIGGRNPKTDAFEGIHWHVSNNVKVEYQPLNRKRTSIGTVKVTHPDGVTEEFVKEGAEPEEGETAGEWRTMDCIDCHNRPTHVYDRLEERVDFGLLSGRIDQALPGIREDSIIVLKKDYPSREQAREEMIKTLIELQAQRNGNAYATEKGELLVMAGQFLLETYMNNIWPEMKITWGTYREHLGHQDEADGYGCFRCHDDEHQTKVGKVIRQDCDLCHDEPM
ncbi:MAG: cytochrome C [Desulfobulbus sp.]|nr:MAG: cytochrome C [Desulfobulbus sp.]